MMSLKEFKKFLKGKDVISTTVLVEEMHGDSIKRIVDFCYKTPKSNLVRHMYLKYIILKTADGRENIIGRASSDRNLFGLSGE